ncbi:MAG: FAD-binding domain-containing protein [Pseudomonadota bacterium]
MRDYQPTREAGLAQLEAFAPKAGRAYAAGRNTDPGPEAEGAVSALSPWVRHRLVLEEEVVRTALSRHAFAASEKFVQEVYWRAYFKGWLERRPEVWLRYKTALADGLNQIEKDGALRADYHAAVAAETGTEGFDDWARELVETGWLHNHARMWFASIWIFTLRLPWALGADFFLRHLMDGDAASNTLSWRWVGGLHTRGKTYLARADNIETFTNGRFRPTGLAPSAPALDEAEHPAALPAPQGDGPPMGNYLLLITDDDLAPETADWPRPAAGSLILSDPATRSPLGVGETAAGFVGEAVADAAERTGAAAGEGEWGPAILSAAEAAGVKEVATLWTPVGWTADRLNQAEQVLRENGVTLRRVLRPYDRAAWPHAHKGFFNLKKQIPKLVSTL